MVGFKRRRPHSMLCLSRLSIPFFSCWIYLYMILNTNTFPNSQCFTLRVVEGFLTRPTGLVVGGIRGCHRLQNTCSIATSGRNLFATKAADDKKEKKTKTKSKRGRPKGSRPSKKTKLSKGKVTDKSNTKAEGQTEKKRKKKKKFKKKKGDVQDPLYWRKNSDTFQVETLSSLQSNNETCATSNVTELTQSQMIRFTVRGKPIPLRRHRTSRGFMYNPSAQAQEAFKQVVRNMTSPEHNSTCKIPLFSDEQYLEMRLVFRLRRPRNHFVGSKPGPGRLRPTAPHMLAPTRTDVDNLAKFVLDSLNELLYVDDRQVVSLHATKVLDTEGDCLGATEVYIKILTEDDIQDLVCI